MKSLEGDDIFFFARSSQKTLRWYINHPTTVCDLAISCLSTCMMKVAADAWLFASSWFAISYGYPTVGFLTYTVQWCCDCVLVLRCQRWDFYNMQFEEKVMITWLKTVSSTKSGFWAPKNLHDQVCFFYTTPAKNSSDITKKKSMWTKVNLSWTQKNKAKPVDLVNITFYS